MVCFTNNEFLRDKIDFADSKHKYLAFVLCFQELNKEKKEESMVKSFQI